MTSKYKPTKIIVEEIDYPGRQAPGVHTAIDKSMSWADIVRQPAKTTDNQETKKSDGLWRPSVEEIQHQEKEQAEAARQAAEDEWRRAEEAELDRYHRAYEAYVEDMKNSGGIG